MEAGRGDAQVGQPRHLVDHQRDQRRDHDREPALDDARHPVGDALARPGRGDEQDVGARLGRGDDLALPGPELGQPEDFLENGACRG